MKKNFIYIAIFLGLIVTILLYFIGVSYKKKEIKKDSIRIGMSLYNFNDTFISNIKEEIENYKKEYEKEKGIRLNIEIMDAAGSQFIQNKQIEKLIALKYDVICINPVERSEMSNIINKAQEENIPIIFFNRKPVEDDMNRYDRLYYVGADPKESAELQAKILIDEYSKDKKAIDINGDGIVSYVLLEGEPNHQDSLIRTEWVVKSLKKAKIPIKKLAGSIANWNRNQAAALMEGWLTEYKDKIELVISNNDDMAIGAIDILSAREDYKTKVVGIDATKEAIENIKKKKLFGTVASDKKEYAKVIIDLAVSSTGITELDSKIKDRLINDKYYNVGQYILK